MAFYLAAEHIQKRYSDMFAVADASLELRRGEILALIESSLFGSLTVFAAVYTATGLAACVLPHETN